MKTLSALCVSRFRLRDNLFRSLTLNGAPFLYARLGLASEEVAERTASDIQPPHRSKKDHFAEDTTLY
nr:hypothetical protein EC90111_C0023 [Escherichia coli 9.0111]